MSRNFHYFDQISVHVLMSTLFLSISPLSLPFLALSLLSPILNTLEKMWQLFPWKFHVLPRDKTNFPAKFVFSVKSHRIEMRMQCHLHSTVPQNHRNNFYYSMTVIFYWNFMSVPRHLSTYKITHKLVQFVVKSHVNDMKIPWDFHGILLRKILFLKEEEEEELIF